MKSKTIGYTTQKLNRNFHKPTFEGTTKQIIKRISNSYAVDFFKFYLKKASKLVDKVNENETIRLFATNGRKYSTGERLKQFCNDFNRNRQANRLSNHFASPSTYNESETQMAINNIKFGKI